jgi:hypothetical protein
MFNIYCWEVGRSVFMALLGLLPIWRKYADTWQIGVMNFASSM